MRKIVVILLILLTAVVAVAWCSLTGFQRNRIRMSIRSLGYTNVSFDAQGFQTHEGLAVCMVPNFARAVVLQVSNASPFAVVRGRNPEVTFDSPSGRVEYVPTGWSVLQPRECERFELEPPINGTRWKLTIECEPYRGSSYYVGPLDFRQHVMRLAIWLQDHNIWVPAPSQLPATQFSSDWVSP